jgi:hypothetical protein
MAGYTQMLNILSGKVLGMGETITLEPYQTMVVELKKQ